MNEATEEGAGDKDKAELLEAKDTRCYCYRA